MSTPSQEQIRGNLRLAEGGQRHQRSYPSKSVFGRRLRVIRSTDDTESPSAPARIAADSY